MSFTSERITPMVYLDSTTMQVLLQTIKIEVVAKNLIGIILKYQKIDGLKSRNRLAY